MAAAIVDASVLCQFGPRDPLLRVAEYGAFDLRWAPEIFAETCKRLRANFPHGDFDRLVADLARVFDDGRVDGYEASLSRATNHPADRHVFAAAIAAGAEFIVTNNLRHFPARSCQPHDISALSPDRFLIGLYATHSDLVRQVVRDQAVELSNCGSEADVPARLEDQLPTYVSLLRRDMLAGE